MKSFLSSLVVSSCLLAVSAFAGSITLTNNTNYSMEVSGMAGLKASVNPVPAHGKTLLLSTHKQGVAHLMFIDGKQKAYAGNVIVQKKSHWRAVSLYKAINVKRVTNGFSLRGKA